MTMAVMAAGDSLVLRVLEDSRQSGLFVVRVRCSDRRLLAFWLRKPAFRNGPLEQTAVWPRLPGPGGGAPGGVDFVLRVVSREPGVPNGQYWAPFALALCLDARSLRYRLPADAASGRDIQRILAERGELLLIR